MARSSDERPDLRRSLDFRTHNAEYEIEEVLVSDTGMIKHNPVGVHLAFIESVTRRMRPFRILEELLADWLSPLCCFALAWDFYSGPTSTPLVNLANAARESEQGQYEALIAVPSRARPEGGA